MSGPDANSSAGVATGVFQISPSNVTGLNGAQLVISCYADSNPTEVRWTVDGGAVNSSDSLQIGYSDGEGVITFSPLGYQHEGVYRCTAYGGSGGEQFASYPGRVRVYGERAGATVLRGGVLTNYRGVRGCSPLAGLPGFITPPSPVGVLRGGMGVFTCVVGSNPPGNTSWLFRGAVLQNTDKHMVFPERLEVVNVQMEDEGYYECLASNKYGSVPASALLSIVNGGLPSHCSTPQADHAADHAVPPVQNCRRCLWQWLTRGAWSWSPRGAT